MGQFIKREDYLPKTHMYEINHSTEVGSMITNESTKAMVIKKEYRESYYTLNDGSMLYEIEQFEAIVLKWRNVVLILNQDWISKDDLPIICKFIAGINADAAERTYKEAILDFCTKDTGSILDILESGGSISFDTIAADIGERHAMVLKDCVKKICSALEDLERA